MHDLRKNALYHEYTDGTFVWPIGLSHHVTDHSVRLPDEVVQHIVAQPPRLDDTAVEALIDERTIDDAWWRSVTGG